MERRGGISQRKRSERRVSGMERRRRRVREAIQRWRESVGESWSRKLLRRRRWRQAWKATK